MSDAYVIPLTPEPQTFAVTLSGVNYRITVRWNESSACWVFDLADGTGVAIISGISLVAGVDLLAQYKYLELGGALYAQSDSDPDAPPGFADLGKTSRLYWVPA